MSELNVEKIIEEIRSEIKEKGYKEEDLKFQDIPIQSDTVVLENIYDDTYAKDKLKAIKEKWDNPMFFPNPSNNKLKVAFQKAIRTLSKSVFWPIVNFQNAYNQNVMRFLCQCQYYHDENSELLDSYHREVVALRKEVEELKKELNKKA